MLWTQATLAMAWVAALCVFVAACGGDDDDSNAGAGSGHAHVMFGSSQAGAGALVVEFDFDDPVEVTFSQCLGGQGDTCEGGFSIYTGSNPAFAEVTAENAHQGFNTLSPGTSLGLELTAASAGASIKFDDQVLDAAGESAFLGVTDGTLHEHGEWLLALPGDGSAAQDGHHEISMKATTDSPGYEDSDPVTFSLMIIERHDDDGDDGGHGHDDEGDEGHDG